MKAYIKRENGIQANEIVGGKESIQENMIYSRTELQLKYTEHWAKKLKMSLKKLLIKKTGKNLFKKTYFLIWTNWWDSNLN